MNFFNSIFSDDPEPSNSSTSPSNDPSDTVSENPNAENPNLILESPSSTISENSDSVWSFGSLIKNITTQSESVIGNYRREFEEFGSGLLKETSLIRDVASRAVQELPDSIDSGAAVAQESLETVGQAIDNLGSSVWQNTTKILARGKELRLFDDDDDDVGTDNSGDANSSRSNERNLNVKRYSWFDTRMREIQGDPRTYTEEPHDFEDYKKWNPEFNLDEKCEEIENLIQEERMVERIYLELVPVTVDRKTFWSRYFYKVDKLKQAEEARARIMKRAISREEDDEDLSWDVDDDDASDNVPSANVSVESTTEFKDTQERSLNQEVECKNVAEITEVNDDAQEGRCNEGKVSGEKNDSYDSSKDSDLSIISTQPSLPGEEELEWDELGDLGSDGGNKITASSNSKLSDLRSRLTGADEEEDLSWDIEDEEEPMES